MLLWTLNKLDHVLHIIKKKIPLWGNTYDTFLIQSLVKEYAILEAIHVAERASDQEAITIPSLPFILGVDVWDDLGLLYENM